MAYHSAARNRAETRGRVFLMGTTSHNPFPGKRPRSKLGRAFRAAAATVAAAAVFVLWRAAAGFPSSWERRLSKALSSDGMQVEATDVSLHVLPRIVLKAGSVAVYPAACGGDSRRAAISASGAEIGFSPDSIVPGAGWLRGISMRSLELDVSSIASLGGGSGDGGLPGFGPVAFSVRRVAIGGISGAASFRHPDFEVRNVGGTVVSDAGEIRVENASASFEAPGERAQTIRGRVGIDLAAPAVEADCEGDLDFTKLAPLLRALDCAGIAGVLEKIEFPFLPPHLETAFCWDPENGKRSLGATVRSGPFRMDGAGFAGFSAMARARGTDSWSRVDVGEAELIRPEGNLSGTLAVDVPGGTVAVDCVSGIDPLCLAGIAGIGRQAAEAGVSFGGPVEIRCSGTLGFGPRARERTALRLAATAASAAVRGVELGNVAVSGAAVGGALDFPDISAEVFGGTIAGSVSLPTGGLGGGGAFAADIVEARLFRIPLFSGLADVIAKFVPGVDSAVNRANASLRATLDGGRWNVSRFEVSGAAFGIDGDGTAAQDGTDLDVAARVRVLNGRTWLGRRLRSLLHPLSGLLGVRGTGSVTDAKWTLSPFSKSRATR